MIERDFYWINPQSVVIPKGKLQEKIKGLPFKGIRDNRLSNFSSRKVGYQSLRTESLGADTFPFY